MRIWKIAAFALLVPAPAHAESQAANAIQAHPPFAPLHIPHLANGPTLNDFLGMQPSPEIVMLQFE